MKYSICILDEYMDETDKGCEYEIYSTIEKSYERIEKRTCYVLNEIAFFTNPIYWKYYNLIIDEILVINSRKLLILMQKCNIIVM